MQRIACMLALAALMAASPALAQQTDADPVPTENRTRFSNFLGITGLLYTPSAYTLGDREVAAHFHGNADYYGGGFLGGLRDRFEAGLTIVNSGGRSYFDRGETEFLLNAKLNLLRETDNVPAISVGVLDAINELKKDSSWFVVASKYFTRRQTDQDFAVIGHIGYGDGIFDDGVFGGAQLQFNEYVNAMFEHHDGRFNVGVRGRWEGFSLTLGLFHLKHIGGGVSYTASF